jgi:hypothetical protein
MMKRGRWKKYKQYSVSSSQERGLREKNVEREVRREGGKPVKQ